jgi:hypothetical protein
MGECSACCSSFVFRAVFFSLVGLPEVAKSQDPLAFPLLLDLG